MPRNVCWIKGEWCLFYQLWLHTLQEIYRLHKPSRTHGIEAAFNVTLQTSSSAYNTFFLSEAWGVKHLRFQRHKITKVSYRGTLYPWDLSKPVFVSLTPSPRVLHLECHVSGFQQVCGYHLGQDHSSFLGNCSAGYSASLDPALWCSYLLLP